MPGGSARNRADRKENVLRRTDTAWPAETGIRKESRTARLRKKDFFIFCDACALTADRRLAGTLTALTGAHGCNPVVAGGRLYRRHRR